MLNTSYILTTPHGSIGISYDPELSEFSQHGVVNINRTPTATWNSVSVVCVLCNTSIKGENLDFHYRNTADHNTGMAGKSSFNKQAFIDRLCNLITPEQATELVRVLPKTTIKNGDVFASHLRLHQISAQDGKASISSERKLKVDDSHREATALPIPASSTKTSKRPAEVSGGPATQKENDNTNSYMNTPIRKYFGHFRFSEDERCQQRKCMIKLCKFLRECTKEQAKSLAYILGVDHKCGRTDPDFNENLILILNKLTFNSSISLNDLISIIESSGCENLIEILKDDINPEDNDKDIPGDIKKTLASKKVFLSEKIVTNQFLVHIGKTLDKCSNSFQFRMLVHALCSSTSSAQSTNDFWKAVYEHIGSGGNLSQLIKFLVDTDFFLNTDIRERTFKYIRD